MLDGLKYFRSAQFLSGKPVQFRKCNYFFSSPPRLIDEDEVVGAWIYHSLSSSAKNKNAWSWTSTALTSSWKIHIYVVF